MLKEIIAVFIGGGIGSSLRYLISKFSFITSVSFPYSTFITNIIGCFILGLTLGYFLKSNNQNSLIFTFLTIAIVKNVKIKEFWLLLFKKYPSVKPRIKQPIIFVMKVE